VAEILAAAEWRDLGLPHDPSALRRAQRHVHPDLCADPSAGAAFARLRDLYQQPEFRLRVADGAREEPGRLRWTLRPGFGDLALAADQAHAALEHARERRFFTRRVVGEGGGDARVIEYRTAPAHDAVPPARPSGAGTPGVGSPGRPGDSSRPHPTDGGRGAAEQWWFLAEFGPLDTRTSIWVARRLAAAIIQAAQVGWAHTDVNPMTVVIEPAQHGLRLDGWWLGRPIGERLTVRPAAPTPPRYLGGAPADPLLAVAQAAAMLAGGGATGDLRDLFARNALRPETPERFFEEVLDCSRRQVGADRWHPLARPATPPI
jgi:hypothetical protein